ncbi:hypothetical protein [Clostridium cuniculi]|uniref:hypothetical protein n=1 Tax=Clostridium cuniculi TaxID=2548455 RepID=UPI001055C6EF|nr:hypothetical protein [Clostridium cuniculi]
MDRRTAKIICRNFIDKSEDMIFEGFHDVDGDLFILSFSTMFEKIYLNVISSEHSRDSLIQYILNNKY